MRTTVSASRRRWPRTTRKGQLGLGPALGDGLVGVDLDHAIGDDGTLQPWAADVVNRLDAYTEQSPSGHGLRILLRGSKPDGAKCKKNGYPNGGVVEIYDRDRFVTFTGLVIEGRPVAERTQALAALCRDLWPPGESRKARQIVSQVRGGVGHPGSDDELLEAAREAANGAKFEALFDRGDTADYEGDDSAADLALCGLLCFWTGPEPVRIDRLFRRSGLMRPKWDEPRGDQTYGELTLAKCLEGRSEFYTPYFEPAEDEPSDGRESEGASGGPGVEGAPRLNAVRAWPPLQLRQLPPAPAFPLDVYPDSVARFVAAVSESIGCPVDFPAVQCLTVAAGTIGRSVSLLIKDGYFAHASIYAACVGPVSDGKSPSLAAALKPISAIDHDLDEEYRLHLQKWEEDARQAEAKGKRGTPAGRPPKPRRIDVESYTLEKLFEVLSDALGELEAAGAIRAMGRDHGSRRPGRTPSDSYEVHPELVGAPGNSTNSTKGTPA